MNKPFDNILQTIGNTPLVRLNEVVKVLPCKVYAKIETTNPGNSIKDRMALKMISDAEIQGKLKEGFTIIESTSGNTGLGIAIVCAVKKYKCILTIKDKTSKEKIDLLRAYGAKVILCPSDVSPKDNKSCYSIAQKLSEEIPNSIYLNQYENKSNPLAYYETIAPEIWEQTEGSITHLIAAAGTGGTLMGISKYLKEKNENIKVWAVEPFGSLLKKYKDSGEINEKEVYPYLVEGFGQNFLPAIYDMTLIDEFIKVTDKEATIQARELTLREGIIVGFSTGAVLAALIQNNKELKATDTVVLIFHDNGSKYLSKIYNNDWFTKNFKQ